MWSEQGRRALRTNSPDAELGLLWKFFFSYLGFISLVLANLCCFYLLAKPPPPALENV